MIRVQGSSLMYRTAELVDQEATWAANDPLRNRESLWDQPAFLIASKTFAARPWSPGAAAMRCSLLRGQKAVQLMEEAFDHDDTEVLAVLDHEELAVGRHVITLMAGKIYRIRPIKEFEGC